MEAVRVQPLGAEGWDGRFSFSDGKGWRSADRPGDGLLVLLAAHSQRLALSLR